MRAQNIPGVSLYDHQQAKKQQCCQVEKLLLGGAVLKILSVVRHTGAKVHILSINSHFENLIF